MSIYHDISLDIASPRGVDTVYFRGSSSGHILRVAITEYGKKIGVSGFSTFKLKCVEKNISEITGSAVDGNIEFPMSSIGENWATFYVSFYSGSDKIETQNFQIYHEVSNPARIDSVSSVHTLTNDDVQKLHNLQDGAEANVIESITYNGTAVPIDATTKTASITPAVNQMVFNGNTITPSSGTLTVDSPVKDVRGVSNTSVVDSSTKIATVNAANTISSLKITNPTDAGDSTDQSATISGSDITVSLPSFEDYLDTTKLPVSDVKQKSTSVVTNGTANITMNKFGVKFNNATISDDNSLFAFKSLKYKNGSSGTETTIDPSSTAVYDIKLMGGNGVSLSNDSNYVKIDLDTSESGIISATNITPGNSNQILTSYNNGTTTVTAWKSLADLTDDNLTINYNIDIDTLPDLEETDNVVSEDIDYFACSANSTTKKVGFDYMMELFDEYYSSRHKTVVIPITLNYTSWGSNAYIDVTLDSTTLATYGVTASQLINANTRLHIYPDRTAIGVYTNYGIYCSSIDYISSNNQTGVVMRFVKNTTDSYPGQNLLVQAEVRIG